MERGLKFAYSGRKQKKRQYRSIWIVRIGAASRAQGISYNQFISGLKKAGVELDRKILADIATNDSAGFVALCETAKRANKKRLKSKKTFTTEGTELHGVVLPPCSSVSSVVLLPCSSKIPFQFPYFE